MATSYPSQPEMHQDHTEWSSEHAAWLDDLRTWRVQHARAMAALTRLSADLQQHGASLLEHDGLIRSHAHDLKLHERELCAMQQAGLGEQADPELQAHLDCSERQAKTRAAHGQLKTHHREILTDLQKLLRELEAPKT